MKGTTVATLTVRFLLVLGILGFLSFLHSINLNRQIRSSEATGALMEAIGRERYLGSRIGWLATEIVREDDAGRRTDLQRQLRESVDEMLRTHRILLEGDPKSGLDSLAILKQRPLYLDPMIRLDSEVKRLVSEASRLTAPGTLGSVEERPLDLWVMEAVEALVRDLNVIVSQRNFQGEERVVRAELLDSSIRGVTLLAFLLMGLLVFWPMVRLLQTEQGKLSELNASLERRVEERTREVERERQILQGVLDSSFDGVVVADESERILVFNPAAERILGPRPDDLQLEDVPARFGLFRPDRVTLYDYEDLALTRAIRGEQGALAEIYVHPEGRETGTWVEAAANPLMDASGRVHGGVATLRDATLHKQDEALRAGQRRALELLLQGCALEDCLTQLSRSLDRARPRSRTAVVLLGEQERPPELAAAPNLQEALRSVIRKTLEVPDSALHAAIRRPEPVHVEDLERDTQLLELREPCLERGFRAIWCTPIPSSEWGTLGSLITLVPGSRGPSPEELTTLEDAARLMGITVEHARSSLKLERARDLAEAASRAKSTFLANMSHELRTPMNAIIGFSQVLADETIGPLNPRQKRFIKNIEESGGLLLKIIDDILDISKFESGQMRLALSRFDPVATIRHAESVVRPLAENKHLQLDVEVPNQLPPVLADEGKFEQILLNLMGNAVKFTREGGRVVMSARVNGASTRPEGADPKGPVPVRPTLHVQVTDSGIGIRQEDQGRVFEKFEQIDSTYGRKQQGTGIGLALTHELVHLHEGTIWIESTGIDGQGTTFHVELPVDGAGSGSSADAPPPLPVCSPARDL